MNSPAVTSFTQNFAIDYNAKMCMTDPIRSFAWPKRT